MTLRVTPGEIVDKAEASGNPGLLAKADHWSRIRLGEVAQVVNGASFKSSLFNVDGVGMPLIRIRDVGGDGPSTWYNGPFDEAHRVRRQDILVGMDGDFRLARWRSDDGLLNQRVCRIDVDPTRYDARFLVLALQGYLDAIWNATSSTTVKHLSSRSISDIPLPFPDMDEQRRIVDILEDHLSRLDAAEQYLAAANERVNQLQMGVLAVGLRGQLVQDDLSEGTGQDLVRRCGGDPSAFVLGDEDRAWAVPSSWVWTRVADVFEVYVGATPSRANKSLWGGDLAWVSSGEVAFNRIMSTRETVQMAAAGNPKTRIHEPGTVMLAMIGEGKTRGQVAILGVTAAHNQNCASIRVARTPVLPEYVFYFLRERYIETRRVASGGNQPALNKGAIGRIAIPIPPLGTQRRLVRGWQDAEEWGDALKATIQESRTRARLLRSALLATAFSGRLTGRSADMELVEEMAGV